jgi:uncharacterized protein YecE (DUF72 family)
VLLTFRIGTAGWNIPAEQREAFPSDGSHLERYAARFNAVEINSSFYRPHRRTTYERWSASVGDEFRFSVKLPKSISHARGDWQEADLDRFADEAAGLGEKLGAILVQFPPSRVCDQAQAETLFSALRTRLPCPLVCEPRHASWFTTSVEQWLDHLRIARVAADPPSAPGSDVPGGSRHLRYHRLHGSPRIYYSRYEAPILDLMRSTLEAEVRSTDPIWCIFDNTATGAAARNALELKARL